MCGTHHDVAWCKGKIILWDWWPLFSIEFSL